MTRTSTPFSKRAPCCHSLSPAIRSIVGTSDHGTCQRVLSTMVIAEENFRLTEFVGLLDRIAKLLPSKDTNYLAFWMVAACSHWLPLLAECVAMRLLLYDASVCGYFVALACESPQSTVPNLLLSPAVVSFRRNPTSSSLSLHQPPGFNVPPDNATHVPLRSSTRLSLSSERHPCRCRGVQLLYPLCPHASKYLRVVPSWLQPGVPMVIGWLYRIRLCMFTSQRPDSCRFVATGG